MRLVLLPIRLLGVAIGLFSLAIPLFSQTILPPIAEYRGRAQGVVELRNDGDVPLAVLVEAKGFTVDDEGRMAYTALDPSVAIDFGANSFTIPARQSHLLFYKAQIPHPPYWFAVLCTFTKAVPVKHEMRVNVLLPHVVCMYQKQQLKKKDIELSLLPTEKKEISRLRIQNLTEKAGRVDSVECKGFNKDILSGGLPIFPEASRYLTLDAGISGREARCKVVFEEGFSLEVSLTHP